jgi:hypothetical protein
MPGEDSPENDDKARSKVVLLKDDGQGGLKKRQGRELGRKGAPDGSLQTK